MARFLSLIVSLVLIVASTSYGQQFVLRSNTGAGDSSTVIGVLGSKVELPCVVDVSAQDQDFIWQKKLNEHTWLDMAELCEENQRCKVITEIGSGNSKNMTLVFQKLRRSDLGIFSCGVPLDRSTADVRSIELDPNVYLVLKEPVSVEHEFPFGMTSHTVLVGDDLTLSCHLTRDHGPVEDQQYRVRWWILGQWRNPWDLPPTQYGYDESTEFSNLTLKNVTMEDRGEYECILWNAHKFPEFTPDKIEARLSDHEEEPPTILVRVKERNQWELPTITIGVEVALILIIMILVETTKLLPDGDNSSDGSTDEELKAIRKHNTAYFEEDIQPMSHDEGKPM